MIEGCIFVAGEWIAGEELPSRNTKHKDNDLTDDDPYPAAPNLLGNRLEFMHLAFAFGGGRRLLLVHDLRHAISLWAVATFLLMRQLTLNERP